MPRDQTPEFQTWRESMPSEVAAAWKTLSRRQRECVLDIRTLCAEAEVTGLHPAHPQWGAALDMLESRYKVKSPAAELVAWLCPMYILHAIEDEVLNREAETGKSYPIFVALALNFGDPFRKDREAANERRARAAIEERQRTQREAAARQAEEIAERRREKMQALAPLGHAGIYSLIWRAIRRMPADKQGFYTYKLNNEPASRLITSPDLLDVAYAEYCVAGAPTSTTAQADAATFAAQA